MSSLSRTCFVSGVHLICGSIFHNVFIYTCMFAFQQLPNNQILKTTCMYVNIERKMAFFCMSVCEKLTVDSSVVVSEACAAVMRDRTVRQVTVAIVGWGACYH